jgi:hypothetical protein
MKEEVTYCPRNGKTQFASRAVAERVAKEMKRKRHTYVLPAVYFCEDCHTYHITTQSYARSKSTRTRHKQLKKQ